MAGLLDYQQEDDQKGPGLLGGLLSAIGAGMIGYRDPQAGVAAAMEMAKMQRSKQDDLLTQMKLRQMQNMERAGQSVNWDDPKSVMQYLVTVGEPGSAAGVFNTQQVSERFGGKTLRLPMQDGTVMEVAMDANGNLRPLGPSLDAVKDGGQLTFQNGRWGTTPVPGQTDVAYRNKAAETAGSESEKTSLQYGPDQQPVVVPQKYLMQNPPSSSVTPTGYMPRVGRAGPANLNADDMAMQWAGDLMPGLIKAESNGQSDAVSSTGARGIAQMMPSTARSEFGISDAQWNAMNDAQRALYSQMYLAKGLRDNSLDPNRALMAYNAGQAGMEAGKGSPGYASNVLAQSDVLRGNGNPFPTVPTGRFMTEAERAAQKAEAEASAKARVELGAKTQEDRRKILDAATNMQGVYDEIANLMSGGNPSYDKEGFLQMPQNPAVLGTSIPDRLAMAAHEYGYQSPEISNTKALREKGAQLVLARGSLGNQVSNEDRETYARAAGDFEKAKSVEDMVASINSMMRVWRNQKARLGGSGGDYPSVKPNVDSSSGWNITRVK